MRVLLLLLISSLHIVAFAKFNALCTTEADCDTGAGESCTRVYLSLNDDTHRCLTFPLPAEESKRLIDNGAIVGDQRKCITPEATGCISNRRIVDTPKNCCTQQMNVQWDSSVKRMVFACVSGYVCDNSAGCRANIDCPGTQVCIDQKCGSAKPGIDCGTPGNPPLKYRCCGAAVVGQNGMCFIGDGKCSGDSDCKGRQGQPNCCKGQCIATGARC